MVKHPTQIGTATDWVDIAGGRFFALALKANGDLYGWGDNAYGNLGNGNNTDQYAPVKIAENVKSFSACLLPGQLTVFWAKCSVVVKTKKDCK